MPKFGKTAHFVDRPDVFKVLSDALTSHDHEGKRIAICGLGGMGKTQIALEFCYQNKENYQYILWIDADTEVSLNASFASAALRLNLPTVHADSIVPNMIQWLEGHDG